MKILLIDNYDSFTYNLVHLLESVSDSNIVVRRNDQIAMSEVSEFDRLVFSPGPGLPAESGRMMELIAAYHLTKPMLGVCLGHQAIAEFFGAELVNMNEVMHGIATPLQIIDTKEVLFKNLEDNFNVGHYHSWTVSDKNLPADLKITARDSERNIMAIAHRHLPLKGIQFHPESILTQYGKEMMVNWLNQQ